LNEAHALTVSETSLARRIFVVVNPGAGSYRADAVRAMLGRYFHGGDPFCEIHETGQDERLLEVVRDARVRGFELVVAAGGDGTISGVANSLVGSEIPLGIIPLGTANVLARELGIPVDVDGACRLLAGPHEIRSIDAMRVRDEHYFTHVGIGLDALMIRDTSREVKKRFGRIAYIWTVFTHLLGFQPRRFRLVVGGFAWSSTEKSLAGVLRKS
jgi:diacylglycerol kinase family enzyme